MKNVSKQICFIALIALMALAITTPVFSGGIVDRAFNGGAKSLAKQSLNLIKQAATLQEKALGIEEKALALSDKDRRTYQAELERLGFQPPEWLFNDAQALLTGAPPAPESPGGILGFIAGIFGGGNRNSGNARSSGAEPTEAEIQAAIEAAQQILGGGTTAPPATAPTTAPAPTPATTTAPASGGPTTWTAVADSTFGTTLRDIIRAIAYGNNRFVAVGWGGKMAYSADGRSWTAVADSGIWNYPNPTGDPNAADILTADIEAIAWGNNRFVAGGGYFQGIMAYSADGRSWTAVADSPFSTGILAIAFGNNRFVAVGYDGKMAYSADGVSWTRVADSAFDTRQINAIAWGNNRFVAGSANGMMAYSADGRSWTAVTDNPFRSTNYSDINAIAWGGNRFVAVGDMGVMAYSTDGTSWTRASVVFGTTNICAIAYGNGRFVAGGDDGRMAYSSNGTSWTRVADNGIWDVQNGGRTLKNSILAIAYGNSRFVAGGAFGGMAYADW